MISVYNDDDLLSVYKQKRKYFTIFMSVTAVYLAFCLAWLVYFTGLPYIADKTLPKACVYVSSVLYVIFACVFLSIKYSRVRKYYKMLCYVSSGMKMTEENYFYTFRKKSLQKDNIDVSSCVFETWSKKKQEWLEREVYIDSEKPLPDFGEGDLVRYITQSNFIVQYEIVQKHALEFEEEEDDEETEDTEETGIDENTQTTQGENNE